MKAAALRLRLARAVGCKSCEDKISAAMAQPAPTVKPPRWTGRQQLPDFYKQIGK